MAMNDYVPVSWNGEAVTNDKLNQMANNDQFLFDRAPAVRYTYASAGNIIRDTQVKMISGKTPFSPDNTKNWLHLNVYFGSFFSAGCHPIVTATVEATSSTMHRSHVALQAMSAGSEIDQRGFIAVVCIENPYKTIATPGWVHWMAVGY